MYNLHSHTFLSDGQLVPSEVAVRYQDKGYEAIAITDHADYSNIREVAKAVVGFCKRWPKRRTEIRILPGIELTHVPPEQFKPLTKIARSLGIKVVIAHGETLAEPVTKYTNQYALLAGIDILAHPGMISDEDARLAAKRKVFLELTSRKSHGQTNSHVAMQAIRFGAKLILNNDSHGPEDIISPAELIKVGTDSGLTAEQIDRVFQDTRKFLVKRGVTVK